MHALRFLYIALAVTLTAFILWAAFNASFGESFAIIAAMPWGLVSLLDLYIGFACFAAVIAFVERNTPLTITLVALLFVLGNVVAAGWLAWRGILLFRNRSPSPARSATE